MTGRDFLGLAKDLLNSDYESALRTSVSRSYYAIFHHVKTIFVSSRIRLKNEAQDHGTMAHYLESSDLPEVRYIGQKLKDLRAERNDADYDLAKTKFNKNTCTLQYLLAKSLCDKLDSLDQTKLKTSLVHYAERKGDLFP